MSNPNFLSQAQQPQQQQQSAIQAIQPQSEVPTGTAAPVAIQQVPTATQLDPNALKPARDSAGGRPAADFSCYLLQQLQKH